MMNKQARESMRSVLGRVMRALEAGDGGGAETSARGEERRVCRESARRELKYESARGEEWRV